MSTDFRVQMQPGSPHCVPAVALSLLEGMADRECLDNPAVYYDRLTALGMTVPGGVPFNYILPSLALIGDWGANCVGAVVYGTGPYSVPVSTMVDSLRLGYRPFMYVYERSDGGFHAVTAIAADDATVTITDPAGPGQVPAPVSEVLRLGQGAFAYAAHRESSPVGAASNKEELRQYAQWADALIAAEVSPTVAMLADAERFIQHLRALGVAEPYNVRRYGFIGPTG